MTLTVLIQAIVHQTTVLIAELATAGRSRAPIAEIADQVFLDLVRELERQGVSRKVSADMFGLGLRTFQRKIQRLTESSTYRGRSLWTALLDAIRERGTVTRSELIERFEDDDEAVVRGVLHDLSENGLIVPVGPNAQLGYRAVNDEELGAGAAAGTEALETLVWALVYHHGPLSLEELASRTRLPRADCERVLDALVAGGRVERGADEYEARSLVLPLGAPSGFEAAVFDHYQAVVTTLAARLRGGGNPTRLSDSVGGSTYNFEIWPGHPLEAEALGMLGTMRAMASDLRRRIREHNVSQPRPAQHQKLVLYFGQAVIGEEQETEDG